MNQLGEFLTARRALLKPADVGLADFGDRRRVPGLRRSEVAERAGVSVGYLTRLEQGSLVASAQVLEALASALLLSEPERSHLHTLARDAALLSGLAEERVTPEIRQLIGAFGATPVVLNGRYGDVLAWNAAGHALVAGHLDRDAPDRAETRPNTLRMVFLDPYVRALYPDWTHKARDAVGRMRLAAGKYPQDRELAALIEELTGESPEFAEMWGEHPIHTWDVENYEMRHPVLGELRVLHHSLVVPHGGDLRLIVFTAEGRWGGS